MCGYVLSKNFLFVLRYFTFSQNEDWFRKNSFLVFSTWTNRLNNFLENVAGFHRTLDTGITELSAELWQRTLLFEKDYESGISVGSQA
jgi:hypothetical protein